MSNDLSSIIQTTFKENQLFSFQEIPLKGLAKDEAKKDLRRLIENGSIKRFGSGLFYLPSKDPSETPTVQEAVSKRYITNGTDVYGFYYGRGFISHLLLQKPSDQLDLYTNSATSNKKSVFCLGRRLTIRKPYYPINRQNAALNAFLTFLTVMTIDEIAVNYSILANYIRQEHLSAQDAVDLLEKFPAKTADKLLRSGLYKNLWKH